MIHLVTWLLRNEAVWNFAAEAWPWVLDVVVTLFALRVATKLWDAR